MMLLRLSPGDCSVGGTWARLRRMAFKQKPLQTHQCDLIHLFFDVKEVICFLICYSVKVDYSDQ